MDHIHQWVFSKSCGASICSIGDQHAHLNKVGVVIQFLARCYCGWNLASGERLEDDIAEG